MEGDLPKKLVTHNGSYHADDIFAAATLCLFLEKDNIQYEIIRTRDVDTIEKADIVFDVGGIYDPATSRFDHHQPGGAGKKENGIEYASSGLVWKEFGTVLAGSPEVALLVERKLVDPIDAGDNGIELVEYRTETKPYFIQDMFYSYEPTWNEENLNADEAFIKCVSLAKEILSREITKAKDKVLADTRIVSIYEKSENKKILVMDQNYPISILENYPETLFVIYPRKANNDWGAKAVRSDPKSFKNRKDFPKEWGGLRDEQLQKITGVKDAVFCHRALFLAVAKSEQGAIELAKKALES